MLNIELKFKQFCMYRTRYNYFRVCREVPQQ